MKFVINPSSEWRIFIRASYIAAAVESFSTTTPTPSIESSSAIATYRASSQAAVRATSWSLKPVITRPSLFDPVSTGVLRHLGCAGLVAGSFAPRWAMIVMALSIGSRTRFFTNAPSILR